MRLATMFLSLFLLCGLLSAQQKYLVSPKSEVIPVRRGQSAAQLMAKKLQYTPASANLACGTRFTFGFDTLHFPWSSNFGAYHKDVMAEWLLFPATGTVDTLFWQALGSVGCLDSTLYIRFHKSRLGPDYGPGETFESVYYPAPCQSWGYYVNTADLDRKVAPFIDQATDTNWVSTIGAAHPGLVTLPPTIGDAVWGGTQGVAVVDHASKVNFVSMLEYDTLKVVAGDVLFISQQVKGPAGHTADDRTEWATWGARVTLSDEYYPARNWKFYEHDSGPSNCAGQDANSVKRGWVARGGFGDDSLDVAAFNYWYTMTVTSNVPPDVQSTTSLPNTFDVGPFIIEATIVDCNPASPGTAGVNHAELTWAIDGVDQTDISMANTGGDLWEAEVPAQSCIHTISYKVKATDNQGLVGSGANYAFSVVCFSTPYYYPDTGSGSCSSADISTSGSAIPIADFFLPPSHPTNAVTTDDGTAGPFDMGGNFTLFGDDGWRYAWVSVNGGMAASKNATDTIDVNANGLFAAWGFPYGNTNGLRQPGRDTSAVVMARMPINYTAPMSLDLLLADTVGNQYGNIRYEAGPGGDTCLFVVEWDSVAAFATGTTGDPDEEKFRVVFNQCDGTIEYQYDNVGVLGDDTTSICGMQGQTLLEYYYLNQFGTPVETHPRNNWCVKLYPGTTIVTIDGWNMVSVGVSPVGGDYSKGFSYPTALGNVFRYTGSYVPTDPLSNGLGLWAKFSGVQPVGARGTLLNSLTQSVIANWNMIGTIGHPVAIASITNTNCTVAASSYFGYSSAGYYAANLAGPNNPSPGNLLPGYGYWAKATGVSGSPSITMNAGAAVPKQSMPTDLSTLSRITIIDAAGHQQSLYIGDESFVREPLNDYEMPPSLKDLTGFDARYTSGRMLETYPSQLDEKGTYEYPIRIEAAVYPVTIQWNTVKGAGRSLVLTSPDAKLGNTVMNGSGAVRLTDANIKTVVVTLKDVQVPTRWALGQNYPNPFNPTTRFAVDVPKTAEVSVAIYDILGRKINTLMSGQQAAGSYGIEWDGRDARGMSVPTGIYFVRMTASDFNATQKIMLMK